MLLCVLAAAMLRHPQTETGAFCPACEKPGLGVGPSYRASSCAWPPLFSTSCRSGLRKPNCTHGFSSSPHRVSVHLSQEPSCISSTFHSKHGSLAPSPGLQGCLDLRCCYVTRTGKGRRESRSETRPQVRRYLLCAVRPHPFPLCHFRDQKENRKKRKLSLLLCLSMKRNKQEWVLRFLLE